MTGGQAALYPPSGRAAAESGALQERIAALEEASRATLNILEDFDEEKGKMRQLQQATVNLLEDFDEERSKLQLVQKATINLLEDMHEERNKLGEAQRALLNILDDVEVERAKAERAKALTETVNNELEAFSYSVSHDLRAPLRAISGFSEAVIEDYAPKLDDEGRRYLRLIQENAHKMGQLIDDLLAFSRLGRQGMAPARINLSALAEEVFGELAAQVPGRDIKFTALPSPPAWADRALLRQVLVNLLANAIKFTRHSPAAAVNFGYLPGAGGGEYYVRDNGAGFDMQYAGKLFGVFQRLHADTEFEGTGVGLALAARIINRHGGLVRAESKLNEGAAFYFTLPPGGLE